MAPHLMNVDLPPLSAFAPDPAVARVRVTRDTLTLAQPVEEGPLSSRHEVMSGTVLPGPLAADASALYRAASPSGDDLVLTITF